MLEHQLKRKGKSAVIIIKKRAGESKNLKWNKIIKKRRKIYALLTVSLSSFILGKKHESQSLHFLLKVCRARVIKNKNLIDHKVQGGRGEGRRKWAVGGN